MEKLKEIDYLAKRVKDSYDDFVEGLKIDLKRDGRNIDKMIDYMKQNPDLTTTEIIHHLNVLQGVDEVPLRVVDDEAAA